MRIIILLLIICIFSCKNEAIDSDYEAYKQTPRYELEQKISKAMELKVNRNVYSGYVSILNPIESCVGDINESYYQKSRLYLENDSAYMEKAGIFTKNDDEYSCIDKGYFTYYKGTIDTSANRIRLYLFEILRSCGEEYEEINGKYKRVYDTLYLEGQIKQNELILNNISYKLKVDSQIFMSMFYERDTTSDILDSL